jgi:hypothetical protein
VLVLKECNTQAAGNPTKALAVVHYMANEGVCVCVCVFAHTYTYIHTGFILWFFCYDIK